MSDIFKNMNQLQRNAKKRDSNVENGIGEGVKNRPIVILYDDEDGFYYFLKVVSVEYEGGSTPKPYVNKASAWAVLVEPDHYTDISQHHEGGPKASLVDCSKIYKMNKTDFEKIYGQPKMIYEVSIERAIDIYGKVFSRLFPYDLPNYSEAMPYVALIESFISNKSTNALSSYTHYMHPQILHEELKRLGDNTPPRQILDRDGQMVSFAIFQTRLLQTYNKDAETLKELKGIQAIIGDMYRELRYLNEGEYDEYAFKGDKEVILTKIRSVEPGKAERICREVQALMYPDNDKSIC